MASKSGLVKQKEVDWKETNLALFGSDVEKNVNKLVCISASAVIVAHANISLSLVQINYFVLVLLLISCCL